LYTNKNYLDMKKFLTLLSLVLIANLGFSQNLTDTVGFQGVLVPQYMGSGSSSRLPIIYRAKLTNLDPNTTYRFYTNLAANTDLGTSNSGAGNPFFVSSSSWSYSTGADLKSTTGGYSTFTTNFYGEYEGWFGVVNTGNARFTAGKYVRPSIVIGDNSGTLLKKWAMSDSILVLGFATTTGASDGSGLYGYSLAPSQEIVAVYEQISDTRPSSVTFIDGVTVSGASLSSLAKFYNDSVRTRSGAWGTIIRNDNANGIQKIERWSFANGTLASTYTDSDGVWPSSADTRSATAGITGILITETDASLKAPTIDVDASGFTNDFGLTYPNTPSSGSNLIVSATDLTDTLYISVNAPFEARLGVNAYSNNTIKIVPVAGVIATTVLDVRFNPNTTGAFSDTLYLMSAGAGTKKIILLGNASNNPEVSLNDAKLSVNEGGGSVNVRVNIKNANSNSTSFTLTALTGSSATVALDYTFTSPQTYTFPANTSDSIVINIPIIDDLLSEGNETLMLAISNPTNGAVLGTDTIIITIIDNDFRKANIGDITNTNANGILDSLNKMYEITGVVYGGNIRNTTQTGYQFTLIDKTGGVAIYNPTTTTFGYTVAQGDSLTVRGVLGFFNGLAEMTFIDTVIFHQSNVTLKQPVKITVLDENAESDLVRMDNLTIKPGVWTAGNHRVYLPNGDSTEVRIANDANNLIGVAKPTKKFSVIGIGGQFDASSPYTSGYQLFPRDINDIIIAADSLSAFNLLTLADGSSVTIQGASTQTVDFTWEASVPAQGLTPASYTILFDLPTGDFSSPLKTLPSNVGGTATALTYPYFQILDLIAPLGLSVGQSVSLKWTVVATTTNNYSKMASQSNNITFVRGVMNGVNGAAINPLTVFPNPANNSVYLEMPETITNVVINTIEGKQVATMGNVGANKTSLEVSNLSTGIYTVSVQTATGVYTQRLAIQR
jgi:hypothetical protein